MGEPEVDYLLHEVRRGRWRPRLLLWKGIVDICILEMFIEPSTSNFYIILVSNQSPYCCIRAESHPSDCLNVMLTVVRSFTVLVNLFPSFFVILGQEFLNIEYLLHVNNSIELLCRPIIHHKSISNPNQVPGC